MNRHGSHNKGKHDEPGLSPDDEAEMGGLVHAIQRLGFNKIADPKVPLRMTFVSVCIILDQLPPSSQIIPPKAEIKKKGDQSHPSRMRWERRRDHSQVCP